MARLPVKVYLGDQQLYKESARSSDYWTRPRDWLTLPNAPEPEGIYALVAVFNDDANFIAVRCQGAYTVDWGDGTISNYLTNGVASRNYNWNDISSSTLTSRGYRQVLVKITPQVGNNLTTVNFSIKHPETGLVNLYSNPWLEINVNMPNATSFVFSGTGNTAKAALLERVYIKTFGNIGSAAFMFRGAHSLQSLNEHEWNTSNLTNIGFMFSECHALKSLDARSWNLSATISLNSTFEHCYSLKRVEGFENWNVSNVSNFSGTFQYCHCFLEDTPDINLNNWNTLSATVFTSTFREVYNLKTINLSAWNTSNVTTLATTFRNCSQLQFLDLSNLNFSKVISLNEIGTECYSLKSIKFPNISSVTNYGANFLDSATNLSNITFGASGINATVDFANCSFSGSDLNYIYQNLSTTGSGKTIIVSGNYGVNSDDPTIATAKGWTVTG